MVEQYYSDQIKGVKPRVAEEISLPAWGGIVAIIHSRVDDGSFGYRYPLQCDDGGAVCGCNVNNFSNALKAEIPEVESPFNAAEIPSTLAILDLLQFCYKSIGKPSKTGHHSFYRHDHLDFDPDAGKADFSKDVNCIFARNGIAYELSLDGAITRVNPSVLHEALQSTLFTTGDKILDDILEDARKKILNPSVKIREESLEKLWDAWERIKTLEMSNDKKQSIKALLDKASSEPNFRQILEDEAKQITDIGNNFKIRHTEVNQTPLQKSEYIDYLFHRLFALIRMLLKLSGRGG